MRNSLTKRYILYFLIHFSFSYGQNVVQNVDWDINEDNEMVITYTLNPEKTNNVYKISVSITSDGGRTWFSPRSTEGDLGKQKGYGNKQITWDIFSDRDELEGDTKVTVKAQKMLTFKDRISKLTSVSETKRLYTSGIYYSYYYPQTTFRNSTFKKQIDNGYIIRDWRWGFGMRIETLPVIFDLGIHAENFLSDSTRNFTYDVVHRALQSSISIPFLSDYYKALTPHIGLGYQMSRLVMNSLIVNGVEYEPYYGSELESHPENILNDNLASTTAIFLNLGIILELKYLQVGVQNKFSLFGKRNWNQIDIYITSQSSN
jgi:hypothetical protein